MDFNWSYFVDLGLIAVALLAATYIRAKVKFFQRFLIPNAITAGFLLLPLYNFVAPRFGIGTGGLETLIYHLLSFSFISMSLRDRNAGAFNKPILSTSVIITGSLTFQGILGFGMTMLFAATIFPNLFPSFGLFIPLGYELGPGQAFAIGKGWEALGFEGAGSIGLTFAALGFIWACFGGIFLINLGIRKKWLSESQIVKLRNRGIKSGVYGPLDPKPVGSYLTTESEAVDGLTLNFAIVGAVYLATYFFLRLVTFLLSLAGPLGEELAVNLWGLSFIFAALLALVAKAVIGKLGVNHVLDNGSLSRISGISVDLLVSAAIGAISLVIVMKNIIPILVLGVLAGVFTMVYVLWMASRLFKDHAFERAIMLYGASTGTLPTGLALLRVLDPEFESPVAVDYMYGSGIAFFLAIPYVLSINLPAYGYARSDPSRYWLLVALLGGYLIAVLVAMRLLGGKGTFRKPFSIRFSSMEGK